MMLKLAPNILSLSSAQQPADFADSIPECLWRSLAHWWLSTHDSLKSSILNCVALKIFLELEFILRSWKLISWPGLNTLTSRIIEYMYIELNQGFFQCPWGPWTWEERKWIPWKNIVLEGFICQPLLRLLSNHWTSLTLMISLLISQCSLNGISTC